MIFSQKRYFELLALTKQYLLQEFLINDKIFTEAETYSYFKTHVLQNKKQPDHSKIEKIKPILEKTVVSPPLIAKVENKESEKFCESNLIKVIPNPPTPKPKNEIRNHPVPRAEEEAISHRSLIFKLDPPTTLPTTDFTELRKIIHEKLPKVQFFDQLPDDSEAKQLANSWAKEKQAAQVLILSFDEPPKHQLFLSNIAKALQLFGLHAVVANAIKMERHQEWLKMLQSKELKLVIASSSSFFNLPELQKHYREEAKQARHYLGEHLLLLLSDIGFYFKEPALKPSLWKALKELLALV